MRYGAFHNAFRNDMKRIDSAALDSARGKEGLAVTIEQFRFLTKYWSGMPMEKRQLSFPLSKMSPLWLLRRI